MIINVGLKGIARICTIVVHDHDKSIWTIGLQFVLNRGDEFCRRSPIFFATQNPHPRQAQEIIGNGVRLLFTNAKLGNRDDNFIWWPGLIKERLKSRPQMIDSVRQR